MGKPRWWSAGDLDGFLGLGLNNLIQILLIVALCRGVLGYPDSLIFGAILPATGISLVVGNLAYARQAFQLDLREGRDDRTALPYGINTVSLFAYVFLVMLPVKLTAVSQGLDPALSGIEPVDACLRRVLSERGAVRNEVADPGWLVPAGPVPTEGRLDLDPPGRGRRRRHLLRHPAGLRGPRRALPDSLSRSGRGQWRRTG